MSSRPLEGISACVFDAYGTLFDFGSAAARCRDAIGENLDRLTALWRDKQLQYTWLRSLQGTHADFLQVTGDALDFAMETLGLQNEELRERLLRLYLKLDVFPDVRNTLTQLREKGLKTAILSNGAPAMLQSAVEYNGIGHLLDAVLSAEAVRIYKPHASVYSLAEEALGGQRRAIVFLSANAWDACGAAAFGLRVVWCNRYGQRRERLPTQPDFEVKSLVEIPALVAAP